MSANDQKTEVTVFNHSLVAMKSQFQAALPAHISADKFIRVVQTVTALNPDLLMADRRSLFGAATKCAQDGLIPDGREAALVIFNQNTGTKQNPKWIKSVQYMPMVAGIMKKVRNSGTIKNWSVHVVKDNDQFDYELGDDERLSHKPALKNRGKTIAAYSIVTLKDGTKTREVMSVEEMEAVRKRSKNADSGPWVSDTDEMYRKTVIRRHAKRLDTDTEEADRIIAQTIRADDELTDLTGEPELVTVTQETDKPTKPRRLPSEPSPETPQPPVDVPIPGEDEMP